MPWLKKLVEKIHQGSEKSNKASISEHTDRKFQELFEYDFILYQSSFLFFLR